MTTTTCFASAVWRRLARARFTSAPVASRTTTRPPTTRASNPLARSESATSAAGPPPCRDDCDDGRRHGGGRHEHGQGAPGGEPGYCPCTRLGGQGAQDRLPAR